MLAIDFNKFDGIAGAVDNLDFRFRDAEMFRQYFHETLVRLALLRQRVHFHAKHTIRATAHARLFARRFDFNFYFHGFG